MSSKFPQLNAPPINEVVCGFLFDPIPELTSPQHGAYWVSRKSDFPTHEVLAPLVDQVEPDGQIEFALGAPILRTWLVNGDGTRLVQVQHDRMFVNWRRRVSTDAYPRFHAREGTEGLLAYALAEFEKFASFVKQIGKTPNIHHVELTKIDVLLQATHWQDLSDLRALLPWVSYSLDLGLTKKPAILLRFEERHDDGGTVRVTAGNGVERESKVAVVRLETTVRAAVPVGANIGDCFKTMNERVNQMFFKLVPSSELGRFGVIK